VIEAHPEPLRTAIFRFLSRNETKPEKPATEEEHLDEIVRVLRDKYREDLEDAARDGKERDEEREIAVQYPKYAQAAKEKAIKYKDMAGYKRLLAVPSFTLGLVMVTRVRRHYQRAPWFKVATLGHMLENHGAVSDLQTTRGCG